MKSSLDDVGPLTTEEIESMVRVLDILCQNIHRLLKQGLTVVESFDDTPIIKILQKLKILFLGELSPGHLVQKLTEFVIGDEVRFFCSQIVKDEFLVGPVFRDRSF